MSIELEDIRLHDLAGSTVFMIGIGGCSMSGLALLLKDRGFDVLGSSSIDTEYLPMLREHGIPIFMRDDPARLEGVDLLVYSHAISMDNPLIRAARHKGIPVVSRSWLLGQLSAVFDRTICVCGTHGKTTVTSMLALILIEAGRDPTVHIGGIFPAMGGNVRNGNSDLFLTEACEYQRSFLSLRPTGIVLMNIEAEHLDCYRDIDEIEETFGAFLGKLPEDGWALAFGEDERALNRLRSLSCRTAAFGTTGNCAYRIDNATEDLFGYYQFDFFHDSEILGHVRMGIPGRFNAVNAAAALSAAHMLGVDMPAACETIERFRGAHRRFELTGTINGAEVFHDYGHNPPEMKNAVSIARKRCRKGRLWAVMQPNNFVRVKELFQDYLTCTKEADITLVTDIYGDRTKDTGGINSKMLVEGMREHGVCAVLTSALSDAAAVLRESVQPSDLVITMGGGDIYLLNELLKEPEERIAHESC